MKKFLFLPLIAVLFISCSKEDEMSCVYTAPTTIAPAAEVTHIQDYLAYNNITAVQHSNGVFYSINAQGTGAHPSVCSNITVKYVGRFLGGAVFDSNVSVTGVKFVLGTLIKGWQIVLPIIQAGGSVSIYVPPSLGYGETPVTDQNDNVVIPAHSFLHFEIDLLDVQ